MSEVPLYTLGHLHVVCAPSPPPPFLLSLSSPSVPRRACQSRRGPICPDASCHTDPLGPSGSSSSQHRRTPEIAPLSTFQTSRSHFSVQGYLLYKKTHPLGPYRRPMPRALGGSCGVVDLLWGRYPRTNIIAQTSDHYQNELPGFVTELTIGRCLSVNMFRVRRA